MGALAGITAKLVFEVDYLNGVLVGLMIYIASFYIARYSWYRDAGKESIGKIYSTGYGGYALVFLFTWILLYTLYPASV